MTEKIQSQIVSTNIRPFYRIAQEACAEMSAQQATHTRPKTNGEFGNIPTFDPDQKSFKSALITLVFSCVCLDALLHLLIIARKGHQVFNDYDRKPYEDKLKLLGCDDLEILKLCERIRTARREVVHEKAHLDQKTLRVAQTEAAVAIDLVNKVFIFFNIKMG